MDEIALIQRALELAAQARRIAPPNPWVGCVLVNDGEIVGEGATEHPGGAHAEVIALRMAGERARGATAYVTLEPCAHYGQTSPCAKVLREAGIKRVVIAIEDPDSRVHGQGVSMLREAGMQVEVGIGADAARELLAPYLHHRETNRSYCVLKTAMSIDGRVAAGDGTSQWITGELARADAHDVRADSQAILIGAGTAIADQPMLTVRDASPMPYRPPWRVLLDARGRVPAKGPLFDQSLAPTLVITTTNASPESVNAWKKSGAQVEVVRTTKDRVDLRETLQLLGSMGVLQAMVEGGPTLHGSFLDANLVNQMVVYLGNSLLGIHGTPAFLSGGPQTLENATEWQLVSQSALGDDLRVTYLPLEHAD